MAFQDFILRIQQHNLQNIIEGFYRLVVNFSANIGIYCGELQHFILGEKHNLALHPPVK